MNRTIVVDHYLTYRGEARITLALHQNRPSRTLLTSDEAAQLLADLKQALAETAVSK